MFLHIKDMKHIKWDFVLMPRSYPRVGTGGARGAKGVKILFSQTWSFGISN